MESKEDYQHWGEPAFEPPAEYSDEEEEEEKYGDDDEEEEEEKEEEKEEVLDAAKDVLAKEQSPPTKSSKRKGSLRKGDIIAITVMCVLAAVGGVLAVLFLVILPEEDELTATSSPTRTPTINPTDAPSASPTSFPSVQPTEINNRHYEGLEKMRTASNGTGLPLLPEDLIGAKNRTESTPQEKAAEWLLYDDPLQAPARDKIFLERYALAVLYYNNGGSDGKWRSSKNWLKPFTVCLWDGVTCGRNGKTIDDITLKENNLVGSFPYELSTLTDLRSLDFSNNGMTGEFPGEVIAQLDKMFQLILDHNQFHGNFPHNDVANANNLNTLWIHYNDLTGILDRQFCDYAYIIIDCDQIDSDPLCPLCSQAISPCCNTTCYTGFFECNNG